MNCPILTTALIKSRQAALTRGGLAASDFWQAAREAADRDSVSRAYLWRPGADAERHRHDAAPLRGLPVSVKDNMDVAGWPTSCGARFFAAGRGPAARDAAFVAGWRRAGARFTGKTHLNAFAYGLTGENRDYGDCVQPDHPGRLTGGSSSGAAASVLSGSAMIGLGTDTGGSLRVPAALCGLVSLRLTPGRVSNAGWFPLAETYTGGGWVQRHLADAAWVAEAVLGLRADAAPPARLGVLQGSWLEVCEKPVAEAASRLASRLSDAGFAVEPAPADGWEEAVEIFVPLQAREAFAAHAELLARHAVEYEPAIRARLETGRELAPAAVEELTARRDRLVARLDRLWDRFDVLVAPACPLTRLAAGGDHGPARRRLLQLTTPASLARWPALTVPWRAAQQGPGIGFQFLAPRGGESALLALANRLADGNWQAGGELTA